MRKRNLKATVQKGKKPHHFLDFLFLADSRDSDDTIAPAARNKRDTLKTGTSTRKRSDLKKSSSTHGMQHSVTLKTPTSLQTTANMEPLNDQTLLNFDWSLSGSIPHFNPGFMVPKVTPPRMHPYNSFPYLELSANFPCPDLPPIGAGIEKNFLDDKAMLRQITKNGLVVTPKRRASDDTLSIDLEDCQLMDKLTNIFTERENEPMELEDSPLDFDELDGIMQSNMMEIDNKHGLGDSDLMDLLGEELANDMKVEI